MRPWFLGPGVGLLALLGCACGHATALRPAPRGAVQVEAALGGPVAGIFNLPIPIPLSTVGVRYGIADRLDVSAHAHATSLLFNVAGLDAGATWLALEVDGARPALALSSRLYGFAELGRGQPRAFLELTAAASWRPVPWLTPYVSASALAQWGWPVPSLAGGAELRGGRFGLQLELRWYAPFSPTQYMVVDWRSVGGLGAWGVVISPRYTFGGEEAR